MQELLLEQAECKRPLTNLLSANAELEITKCKACGDYMRNQGAPCYRGKEFLQKYVNLRKKLLSVIKLQEQERAAEPQRQRDEALSRALERLNKRTNELMSQHESNESKLNALQRELNKKIEGKPH